MFLVTAQLDHYLCKKILIDIGASVNVWKRVASVEKGEQQAHAI